jgi:hypothetical protein
MRDPDKTGVGVLAWRLAKDNDAPASLEAWLVRCSWAHPMWDHWLISVVHLRPVNGLPPAVLSYPKAEFELTCIALSPYHVADPDYKAHPFHRLTPTDQALQFDGVTDKQAVTICEDFVDAICRAQLSPDQDYRQAWKMRLHSLLHAVKTAAEQVPS